MTGIQIFFILFAALILGAALKVVTARNLLYAAFWLVATLLGVAVMYVFLNAGFLAMVQVVVYVGAIAILFAFTVMLTRRDKEAALALNKNWGFAAVISVAVFAMLAYMMSAFSGFSTTASAMPADFDAVSQLGLTLVSPTGYVLPFEVASVLLLAALVGAIYLAAKK